MNTSVAARMSGPYSLWNDLRGIIRPARGTRRAQPVTAMAPRHAA